MYIQALIISLLLTLSSTAQHFGAADQNVLNGKTPHWSQGPQWWESWPLPLSKAPLTDASEVMNLLRSIPAKHNASILADILLVDVRRRDWEGGGGSIHSSINIPAHAFYPARALLYDICRRAGIKRMVLTCRSSLGRAPRCAGWMQDYLKEVNGTLEVSVLRGGVKAWATEYQGEMMDYYVPEQWTSPDIE